MPSQTAREAIRARVVEALGYGGWRSLRQRERYIVEAYRWLGELPAPAVWSWYDSDGSDHCMTSNGGRENDGMTSDEIMRLCGMTSGAADSLINEGRENAMPNQTSWTDEHGRTFTAEGLAQNAERQTRSFRLESGETVVAACVICHAYITEGHVRNHVDYAYAPFGEGPDRIVCGSCLREHYMRCDGCSSYIRRDSGQTLEAINMSEDYAHAHGRRTPMLFCPTCRREQTVTCHECHQPWYRPDSVRNNDGQTRRWTCRPCHARVFRTCEECGVTVRVEDADRWAVDSEGLCRRCEDNGHGLIRPYSFKPTPKFHMAEGELRTNSTRTYGFEIEVENFSDGECENGQMARKSNAYLKANGMNGWAYYKTDGSLNSGFEIVSHPFTFAWLQGHKDEIDHWLSLYRNEGFRSQDTSTCGLHIHFSKASITPCQLYKFLKFFYENKRFIKAISGRRTQSELNEWAMIDEATGRNKAKMAREASTKCKEDGGRRWAINFSPTKTIEIRIFKGTLKAETLFAAVEFLHALSVFCENGRFAVKDITIGNFIKFVREDKDATAFANLRRKLTRLFGNGATFQTEGSN